MWAILGSLCTAAAWAALIKDGFDISLYHVPAVIYQTYVKIRDPIFDLTFIWLPFTLPFYIKDFISIYLLVGVVSSRAWIYGEPGGSSMKLLPKILYKVRLTLTWPKSLVLAYRIVKMHGLFKRPSPDHYTAYFWPVFWLFIGMFIVSVISVVLFFSWSFLAGVLLS